MDTEPLFVTKFKYLLKEKGIKRISLHELSDNRYRIKALYLEWGFFISLLFFGEGTLAILHSEAFIVGILLIITAIYYFLKNLSYFNTIILDFNKNAFTVINRDLLVWILIRRRAIIDFKNISSVKVEINYVLNGGTDYEIDIQTKDDEKYTLMKFYKKSTAEAFNELFELLMKI